MGLTQIGVSVLAALLVGLFTRGARSAFRAALLLWLSVLAIYWFQPALPFRSFDFWLPTLSLALMLLTWYVTASNGAWRMRSNLIGMFIIVGTIALIALSRYFIPEPWITSSTPPRISTVMTFLVAGVVLVYLMTRLPKTLVWPITILAILLILVLLKSPVLSLQVSVLMRNLLNRPLENASAFDLRWLGFSYIAFRLIHVLRDKQLGRLPDLALPEFATYVVFFPSLSAGPIDRAERFAGDLKKDFALTQDETLLASQRILIGSFKKFVIADTLALIALNDALATQAHTTGWMWVHLYAYAFQIYFDFSGYTDIAIGIARLVGIRLPENFAAPYLKPSLTQFWNSWHMTLTQWIRSYFFHPFNRWIRGFKNLPVWSMLLIGQLATMSLIGLWHGITWNFVLWGAWHGLGLFLQNRWSDLVKTRFTPVNNPRLQIALQVGGILLTFHFVVLGWVFFALSEPSLSWRVMLALGGASR
jgi:D-alanyl-lipoteichoic acid acyltransferase DltB (MBOAT superfamily)